MGRKRAPPPVAGSQADSPNDPGPFLTTREANARRKEADIKAAVRDWRAKRVYCPEYIFKQVAWKFYLDPETVAGIYYGAADCRRERKKAQPARRRLSYRPPSSI